MRAAGSAAAVLLHGSRSRDGAVEVLVVLRGHCEAKRQRLQPLAEQVALAGTTGGSLFVSLRRANGAHRSGRARSGLAGRWQRKRRQRRRSERTAAQQRQHSDQAQERTVRSALKASRVESLA